MTEQDSMKILPCVTQGSIYINLVTCIPSRTFISSYKSISYLLLDRCLGALLEVCGGSLP